MKVIKSKFGSCVQENGKPVECIIDATFLGKFEHMTGDGTCAFVLCQTKNSMIYIALLISR